MLFNLPQRNNHSVADIVNKVESEIVEKPKIKLKGTSLSAKLKLIEDNLNNSLGDLKDNYLLITNKEDWLEYCRNSVGHLIALDTETTGLTINDQKNLVGLCIKSDNQKSAYVPVGHISTLTETLLPNQLTKEEIKEGLDIIRNEKLIFHNAYYDLVVLYFVTGYLLPVYWDTLICAFLLNENESHGLKYLYDKYVMNGEAGVHKFGELFDGIPACYVPYNLFLCYSAHDTEMTLDLYKFQEPFMNKDSDICKEYDLSRVANLYFSEELPLIPVLVSMKLEGIQVDYDKINELRDKYTKLKNKALNEFNEAVSNVSTEILNYIKNNNSVMEYPVNYNSPSQIAILLYDILKVGIIDKGAPRGTGAGIISAILSKASKYDDRVLPIVKSLSEVKKYDKVIGSFIDKIDEESRKTGGRIYSDMNQTSARTGRLASSNPK